MKRILLVEDEAHIAHVLAMWLQRHQFDILRAGNGRDAMEFLQRESVDLIVSDMNMPEMDGLELVREIRDTLKLDVPVFLLSARCDQDELRRKLTPFQVRLHPKPFMPSRLVADIESVLAPALMKE